MSLFKKSEDPWDRQPGQASTPVQEPQEKKESPLDSLKQWNEERKAEKARKEAESAPEPIPCPWCGKRMEARYLWGGRGVYLAKEKPGFFNSGLSVDNLDLCDEGSMLTSYYKTMWYCPDCRKLAADIPETLSGTEFQKQQEEHYRQLQTHPQQDKTAEDDQ
jgi:hypothetical protein